MPSAKLAALLERIAARKAKAGERPAAAPKPTAPARPKRANVPPKPAAKRKGGQPKAEKRAPDQVKALERTFEEGIALDVLPPVDRRQSAEPAPVSAPPTKAGE